MEAKTKSSRSKRAQLLFPVGRVENMMKHKGRLACRIGGKASVALTAVLEHLAEHVLSLAADEAGTNKSAKGGSKTITPRFIKLAIHGTDASTRSLLGAVSVGEGGVVPLRA